MRTINQGEPCVVVSTIIWYCMFMIKEKWLNVFGYEGLYKVSNTGRVKSITRKRPYKNQPARYLQGRFLKLNKSKKGYTYVNLNKNGKGRTFLVHYLVLAAFRGPRPKGMQARHFPIRTKTNNNITNLQWGTSKENQKDRETHGTANHQIQRKLCRGQNNHFAKLKDKDIPIIRKYIQEQIPLAIIATTYHISRDAIKLIKRNKTWRHI